MPDYTWDDLLSWTPSYAATVSTQVDAQAPKKEDEWDKILGWEPLKVEKPSKWEKARLLAEQAGATGAAPIPTGPGILGGEKPNLGEMGRGVVSGVKNFVPDMLKMAGQFVKPLVNPGAPMMEQGMKEAAQAKAKELGVEQPEQQEQDTLGPIKTAVGLAEWWPQMMARFIKDPVGTANKDPFGVLVLATGGQGKEIKAWVGKKKAAKLTKAELKAAFDKSGAANASPELAGAFDYLDRAEEPGMVYGEGGAVIGQNVPEIRRSEPRPTGPTPMPETAEMARPEPIEPQIRQPGPGEVRGLGIEFVDKEGKPMDRGDAVAVKKQPQAAPVPPEVSNQPPLVQDFFAKLREASRLTPQQRELYHIGRQQQVAKMQEAIKGLTGEAAYRARIEAARGPLGKAVYEPLKITQENVDALNQMINDSNLLEFEKLQAGHGLATMLGKTGGGIPAPAQISLLEKVFGPEIKTTIIDKKPWWVRGKEFGVDALSVPKSITSSFDVSFGLRQAIFYAARHPVKFWKEFPNQLKWWFNEKSAKAVWDEVRSRETYPLMRESGLDIIGTEEPFQSRIADKVPGVKQSSRAFTTLATKLRADAFDSLVSQARKAGRDPAKNPGTAQLMAELVNTQTGRGNIGRLDRISKELNATLWSPKLMASRFQVLNPKFYIKVDPVIRKEALTGIAAFAGYAATVVGLSKLAGLDIGVNPTSADFGKIKVGNTRIDLFGGFSQYTRLAAQLISGKITSTTSGKVIKIGEGYKPTTRIDVVVRTLEGKQAPVFSFAYGLFKGQNWLGDKFDVPKEAANRFIPMVIQDFVDLYKDDPSLFPLGFLGVFGAGLQTYKPRQPKKLY